MPPPLPPPISPLFFYGVLMPELVTGRMAALVGLLQPGVPGTVSGDLYAVAGPAGHYPAMIAGSGLVTGQVLGRVHRPGPGFGAGALAELDAFEGGAYARRAVTVQLADNSILAAQAYLWIEPTRGLAPILHGDFARYLKETGAAALPG